jgi:membrane protease YdiL (CAAX protease family)
MVFWLFCFILLTAAGSLAIGPLPRTSMEWGGTLVLTAAAIVAGWISLMRLDNRPASALGLGRSRSSVLRFLTGFGVGGALIAGAALLLLVTGAFSFLPDTGSPVRLIWFFTWTLLFFAISALFEEAIFRGYPFQVLVEWIGVWPAIAIASGIFALMHGRNPGITTLAAVNIFLAGVLLSLAYLRTLSLWFATGVHLGWNWVMAGPFDFPVSGIAFDAPMYSGDVRGAALWTGGDFGPEAGLVSTVVLAAGIVWLLRTRRLSPSEDALAGPPLTLEHARESGLL